MKWSNYQHNIFDDVKRGIGSTIIKALAGSGKTTVLIESLKHVEPNLKWLLVAFNKNIAEELKVRAPKNFGEISTSHSLGLKSLGRTFKNVTVDNTKVDSILDLSLKNEDVDRDFKGLLRQAVSLAKGNLAHTKDEIDNLLDNYDIAPDNYDREKFINQIIFTLDICKRKPNLVDFDDMIWLNAVLKTDCPKFERVFVDEGQDFNKAQIEFILKLRKQNNRTFVFMDENQAIYQWRGSDTQAMKRWQESLSAKYLPLSITYRCPKAVVKSAQKFVPELEAAPDAKEGKVEEILWSDMLAMAQPGCFIISRVNAPLIGLALGFLKKGIPCNIQGRDIGENLIDLVRRSKAKTIEKFVAYVEKWKKRECERLLARDKSTDVIQDKADCLFALAESCEDMGDLKSKLAKLFSDNNENNKVILGTCHRLKGLERDTVFVLTSTFRFNTQEELNLNYVSRTRSKDTLYLVQSKKKTKKSGE